MGGKNKVINLATGPDAHILAYYQIARNVYTVDIYDKALDEVWKVCWSVYKVTFLTIDYREIYHLKIL